MDHTCPQRNTMEEKCLLERITDPELVIRKRNMIDNNMMPFIEGLTHRVTRAKVLSYINEMPDGEAIDVVALADACEVERSVVESILEELAAEGYFDE